MKKRTKLASRSLPNYTHGEEIMNMITHIAGSILGIIVLLLCVHRACMRESICGTVTGALYGSTMIMVYGISSIYHGIRPCTAKKVMQVLDHCAIYCLIAGTYTPIMLCGFVPSFPKIGFGILTMQWILAALAITLTAIDLNKYNAFSMICYILMGWSIIVFVPQTLQVMGPSGFKLLLSGGIVYTVGAIIYGIGSKIRWMHSIFHIFVVAGSLLQFLSIYLYVF